MAEYHPIIDYVIVLAVSQGIYSTIDSRYKGLEIDSQITSGQTIELIFKLLSYYYGS